MKTNPEYETFSNAMSTILKANPEVVKVRDGSGQAGEACRATSNGKARKRKTA